MPNKDSLIPLEGEGAVLTENKTSIETPKMYRVLLLNDNYTPMDFVVLVLEQVFHKPSSEAHQLMMDVHVKGRGICGLYPFDVARTKVFQVKNLAKRHKHPLECVMEVA